MRPISSLTALARDIADTRDPSRRMPVPAADDEIGELAETMDGMLKALDEARTERERASSASGSSSPTPRMSCARR